MLHRNTYIEIDLDAFRYNLHQIKSYVHKKVFCVCKANAYSHGDYHIARVASEEGSPYICVSSLDEALSLRHQGFDGDVLILGYVDPQDVFLAIKEHICLTCTSYEWANQIALLDIDLKELVVHLKVDTGMNRLGMKRLQEVEDALSLLNKLQVQVEGIYTHFHSADDTDTTLCDKQRDWFYAIVDNLKYDFKWIHTQNSDATLNYEDVRSNAVRVGLVAYGVKSVESEINVKPVLSLFAHMTQVKKIMKYETVGYGATYTALKDMYIATIPLGYGDGFLRINQGRYVCVNDTPCEIIGRVCMDQCMIRLDKEYPVDTRVEIIGEHIPVVKVAKELQMIPYEVLCLLNDRITRVVKEHSETIAIVNTRVVK